jgi:hypothetical protein
MAIINLNLTLVKDVNRIVITLDQPVMLSSLLEELNIPADQVGMAVKNGTWVDVNHCLVYDKDLIMLFPLLQGG